MQAHTFRHDKSYHDLSYELLSIRYDAVANVYLETASGMGLTAFQRTVKLRN